ncbi:uncharacterized protein MONOS_10216 [Monocercomonoides exilis]|uniref:uncharacterized protein n=1 Tax=Monocercomonoides exilis TaxID=2049356 RepID=UPI00355A19CE|nr:hypothetical protein MONOS_10216 [Monocercomonoides exilis]
MKLLVKKKAEAAQKRLKEAMSTLHYRKYSSRLERIAHIVNDNVFRLVYGVKYGGTSKKSLEHAVKAIKNDGSIAKGGHTPIISCEKEKQFFEEVAIESRFGTNLTFRKARDLDEQAGFKKTAERMPNATLVAGIAADGFSLPSVVLWPSANFPKELTTLLTPSLDICPNTNGWMDKTAFKKNSKTVLSPVIIDRRKRILIETHRCLFLLDSHSSRADPTIWRQFKEAEIDFVIFVPHTTHISQPLDRGVFAVLKSELSNNYSSPSSTSSSSKRTTVADVLPQVLHTAFIPSVIKKTFTNSGVLNNGSGSVLMKLPQSSQYSIPTHLHCFDFFGKEITKEKLLDEWDEYNEKHKMKIEEIEEKEKEIEELELPLKKKGKRKFRKKKE